MKLFNSLFSVALTASLALVNAHAQEFNSFKLPIAFSQTYPQLPQTVKKYTWENDDWTISTTHKIAYNDHNNPLTYYTDNYYDGYILESLHEEYTYNDNQNVKTNLVQVKYPGDIDWQNSLKYEYKYDTVIPTYVIYTEISEWDIYIEDWMPSSNEESFCADIIRDEAQRVVTKKIWDSVKKHYVAVQYDYTYEDEKGPASSITVQYDNGYGQLVPTYLYKDIKWQTSDCQYIYETSNIYWCFTSDKNNLMKSCRLCEINPNGVEILKAIIDVTYDDNNRNIQNSLFSTDGFSTITKKTYYTEPTKKIETLYTKWTDLNGNTIYDEGEEEHSLTSDFNVKEYDNYGNEILVETKSYNDVTGKFDIPKYKEESEYQYLEDGTPTQFIHTQYVKDKLQNKIKYECSDFIKANISKIEETSETLHDGTLYKVYDIQGRMCKEGIVTDSKISLDGLNKGIYVVRGDNNKSVKVIKK